MGLIRVCCILVQCVGQTLDVEDVADLNVQVIAKGNEPEAQRSGVTVWVRSCSPLSCDCLSNKHLATVLRVWGAQVDAPNHARVFSKHLTFALVETKIKPPETGLHQICFRTHGNSELLAWPDIVEQCFHLLWDCYRRCATGVLQR